MLMVVGATVPGQASVGGRLQAGCRLLRWGNLDSATQQFAEAYRQDSRCGEARAALGTVHLLLGNNRQARADFQAAAALMPDSSLGQLGLAAAHIQLGDDQAAINVYEELLTEQISPAVRGQVSAALAYLQCRRGLYDSALAQAATALRQAPQNPLACYVRAATLLARGQMIPAAQAIQQPVDNMALGGLMIKDCLFAPRTHYAQAHQIAQVAPPPELTAQPPTAGEGLPAQQPDFRITYPDHGAVVSGRLRVRLQIEKSAQINYISVLLGDDFVGISNQAPFELTVTTERSPEGWQALRVDGYDHQRNIVRSASVGVVVQNANRTLTPQEQQARAVTAELLRPYLYLQPSPGLWEHLRGYIEQVQGNYPSAVASYEVAFAASPELPRLREDLLAAYQHLDIPTNGSPSEMHQLAAGGGAVALTFDDGPHPKVTPWILDCLDRVGAKATFFLVGKQVELYPELTAEIHRRGHTLASHSYTHRDMRRLSALEIERELVSSRAVIRRATDVNVTLFRPPGGHYDEIVRRATGLWGYTTVFWTANICSYAGAPAHKLKSKLLSDIAPGGIVLLHNGDDQTVDILPDLLAGLKKRGLTMVALAGAKSQFADAEKEDLGR